jgi:hypothetical protein
MNDALRSYRAAQLIKKIAASKQNCDCFSGEHSVALTAAAGDGSDDIPIHGIGAPIMEWSGDGRRFTADALSWDLELESIPIIWDEQDGDHDGPIVGVVDALVNDGAAYKVTAARLFPGENRETLVNLIANNAIGWSFRWDDDEREITFSEPEITEEKDGSTTVRITKEMEQATITNGRVRHLALVDTPAFPVARPVMGYEPALAAAAMVQAYPAAHFERWESREPVPLQVTADGRVWGHAAGDGCFRNGDLSKCTKYTPDPDPKMKNFHTASLTLDNGEVIRVGSLTCDNLHADISMSLEQQRHHHENTSTVWARVQAWDDPRGRLCISGSVVPGLDPKITAQVAGLPVSVERWPVMGTRGVTLVAAHTVVSAAWPVGV